MVKTLCECYCRVVGFLRPEDLTNPGKHAEIQDRVMFGVEEFTNNDDKKV